MFNLNFSLSSKEEKNKISKYLFLKYKFVFLSVCFLIWMFFFDTNSLLLHYNLYKESVEIRKKLYYLQSQIDFEKNWLKKAKSDPDYIERFARENFYMKRDQEDVFIVSQKG